jgi:hypothetical protein
LVVAAANVFFRFFSIVEIETVTILRVGTSQKYSDNFAQAFGGKKAVAGAATKGATKKSAAKGKTPVKSAKKKGSGKKKAATKKKK